MTTQALLSPRPAPWWKASPVCFLKSSIVVRAASTPPVKFLIGCSLPGDYGFDPLWLSDPEGTGGFIEPKWLAYGENINGSVRHARRGGRHRPEIFGKLGLIPAETGVIPPAGTYGYWGGPLHPLRAGDGADGVRGAKPGSMGMQDFLGLEKKLGGLGDPAYPGGPFFHPLGLGKNEKSMKELKLKDVAVLLTSLEFH